MDDLDSSLRFGFGKNWLNFSKGITPQRTQAAVESLQNLFHLKDLKGKRVLDIGCGSGLFSLAAAHLGANIYSFDYDHDAVACTRDIKERYASDRTDWQIAQGSVLDKEFLQTLGSFDIVYSWGVLHHTGSMWKALENAGELVRPGGLLAIAIYNNQGGASGRWTAIKKLYNRSPAPCKLVLVLAIGAFFQVRSFAIHLLKCENPFSSHTGGDQGPRRGMSVWHDLVDWVGGYPFETAKPEEIFDFYRHRSFTLEELKTCAGGHGCNEFVFRKLENR